MKKALSAVFAILILIAIWLTRGAFSPVGTGGQPAPDQGVCKEIVGTIEKGETLFDVFKKWKLDIGDLFRIREASASIYRLREVRPGQPYKIVLDDSGLRSFDYWIDDDCILSISREERGFCAARKAVDYEKRTQHLGGVITDNVVATMGHDRDHLMLALQLSDIYSWDIDFTTDIRKGDTFRIVAEAFYLNGEFRKYGEILAAEFANNGKIYHAYRFEHDGKADYYDGDGKALRKAFLKAPLSFRRISSGFSRGRLHPILRIYRPHHGMDYAAPAGTPVSASGDGTVIFSGHRGQYGKLIILRHPNGYTTRYGHLSRIERGIAKGRKVDQGRIIGYVGATGLATGPHLHYEMRRGGRPINPLDLRIPREKAIPGEAIAEFRKLKGEMNNRLAAIAPPAVASTGRSSRRAL